MTKQFNYTVYLFQITITSLVSEGHFSIFFADNQADEAIWRRWITLYMEQAGIPQEPHTVQEWFKCMAYTLSVSYEWFKCMAFNFSVRYEWFKCMAFNFSVRYEWFKCMAFNFSVRYDVMNVPSVWL